MPRQTTDDFKLPLPTRQDMVDWVKEAYKSISSDKEDPEKVRSGTFYEKCMLNAKALIKDSEG